MKLTGQTLKTLTRVIGGQPFTFLSVHGDRLEGLGISRARTFNVRLTLPECDRGDSDYIGHLRLSWLKRLIKPAGRKHTIELSPNVYGPLGSGIVEGFDVAFGEATARVNGTTYHAEWVVGDIAPVFPERPDPSVVTDRRELAPADFAKGGAVAVAAGHASEDSTRANLNAVHLDALVTGTDGYTIARRTPVSDFSGFDALVPLDVIRTLTTIAQAHAPTAIRCVRYTGPVANHFNGSEWVESGPPRIRFQLVTAVGEWIVDAPLAEAKPPSYEQYTEGREDETLVAVSAGDLAAVALPFRRARLPRVAIYPDGRLLAWTRDGYADGIGTTLEHIPEEPPLVVLGTPVYDLLKALPKEGDVTLGIVPSEDGGQGPVRFADQFFMPIVPSEGIPEPALADLRIALADTDTAAGPQARTCEVDADICTSVPVFGRCVEPTANDNARAA